MSRVLSDIGKFFVLAIGVTIPFMILRPKVRLFSNPDPAPPRRCPALSVPSLFLFPRPCPSPPQQNVVTVYRDGYVPPGYPAQPPPPHVPGQPYTAPAAAPALSPQQQYQQPTQRSYGASPAASLAPPQHQGMRYEPIQQPDHRYSTTPAGEEDARR